jgi:dienelactone hydrolase
VIGETISHYRVVAEIGAGGMGVVYKAEDLRLGRFVALKFLSPQLMRDLDAKRRLFAEARAASALDHANVCTIYDIEEMADGQVFLAMAYCDGETLKHRLERGPLPAAEAVRVALQIARGLARAHHTGIVHRDVKPGNIMVTSDDEAKLLDFGIAKLSGGGDLTQTGTTLGTIAYMSPEHVRGGNADEQGDVWALGVVLYEMLAGRRPFAGTSDYDLLQAIVEQPAAPLAAAAGVDADLARTVSRALEKDRSRRYANAGEMVHALETWLQASTGAVRADTGGTVLGRPRLRGALVGIIVGVVAIGAFWAWRSSSTRWARNVALPEVLRLADHDRYGEAFLLATQAEARLARDPVLESVWPRISRRISITSTPAGADVSFRLIGDDDTWHPVGRTPVENVRLPRGVFQWRFEKPGFEPSEAVRATDFAALMPSVDGITLSAAGSRPAGMVAVSVPPVGMRLTLTGFDYNKGVPAPGYFIDQKEVTNVEFKAFVDAGGYEKREYWTEPFVREGQTLDWTSAMALFRDRTGRPGPATWQGGTHPSGQEQFPVSGVSWYEAAAYAAFRGKHLPTIYHWTHAAGPEIGGSITRTSNFGGVGPAATVVHRALGPYGTYDMAGNVKEWVSNEQAGAGKRYILGGAWNDPDYQFLYSDSRSPFDRSDTNGFRCMSYSDGATPPASLAKAIPSPSRDYATERPVADAAYAIYANQYVYDRTPFEARVETTNEASPHWRYELVTVAAAYGGERLPIHLYLPKNVKPPYQTVLFFPGSGAIRTENSANLSIEGAADFVVMSGRTFAYPVYKYTYERRDPRVTSSWPEPTRAYTTWMQQVVTDARRTIDYLETRPEINGAKFAYYGVSWGARLAPITLALDPRVKAGVLLMGGLGGGTPAPEVDPFNFAPRVKVPILMLNGDQDFIFPVQTSQLPLFQTLGTPAADKRHVLYPGGHEIFATQRSQIIQEIVGWLDRYLGRVQ